MEPGYHELRAADDRVIATLRFEPRPAFRWREPNLRRARAEAGSAHWDLSTVRKGLSGSIGLTATVLITGSNSGNFRSKAFFMTGTLELAGGRCFQWRGGTVSGPSTFSDDEGKVLIRFDRGSIFERINTYVDVQPEAAGLSDWLLLAVLGLYLRLAMNKVFR
jgi:hypothetical protein